MTTATTWQRSSRCDTNACIEIRDYGKVVHLRSTISGLTMVATRDEWVAFVAGIKAGEFDLEDQEGTRV